MAQLRIDGITKVYDKHSQPVLKGINIDIADGEMFFLLGPSGCGKSTLLRIIAGLVEATSGTIESDGKNLLNLPPEKRRTPMVFQNYALWPHMNVAENIAFGLASQGLSKKEIERKVTDMLSLVRLDELAKRKVTSLSGGQQQRVALARALALDPAVLLLDEPLSNLDAKLRDIMRLEIKRICRERHITSIYVTHDRREALSMADRVAVMNNGVIEQLGTPREIYLAPETRFTASFLGDANIFEILSVAENNSVETALGKFTLEKSVPSDAKYIMFRPENVQFAKGEVNNFKAVIKDISYLGESSFRTLECGESTFYANEYAPPERNVADSVTIHIPPHAVTILKN